MVIEEQDFFKVKTTIFHHNLLLQLSFKLLRHNPKNSTAESLSVTVDSWFQNYLAQRLLLHKPQKPRAILSVTKLKKALKSHKKSENIS
jgi:hypothetical protein